MNSLLWKTAGVSEEAAEALVKSARVPLRVARWLTLRGIEPNEVHGFLQPETKGYSSPHVFHDMQTAVARTLRAVYGQERICIVGDYDVDGVTSSAILASAFSAMEAVWQTLIPHRVEDGYGLSTRLVDLAAEAGCSLLITVDNGIRTHDAIRHAAKCGMDVIVTDHHEPDDVLPQDAVAIVHWARSHDQDTRLLSGAGVAWKFALALLDAYGQERIGQIQTLLQWLKGLAALGALADIMPMRGENRLLVKEGIAALRRCQIPGWRALCEVAGTDVTTLTDTKILWNITPRLNAAGRMDSAEVAFQLLMAGNLAEGMRLAEQVEQLNKDRRMETERVTTDAMAQCPDPDKETGPAALVVAGAWNLGVVGIVAAKLVRAFRCPVIALADDGSGVLRGSGRAPEGFDLHHAMTLCTDTLEHFGGHEAAVGCGVERHHVDAFRARFEEVCRDMMQNMPAVDVTVADDYLPLSEATLELLGWLERFEPFGPGFPPLVFYVGPVEIRKIMPMGNGKHARITVTEGTVETELVWFSAPSWLFECGVGRSFSAHVSLEGNVWQGVKRVQLRVNDAFLLDRPVLRDEFGEVYRLLRARRKLQLSDARQLLPSRSEKEAQVIMDTFVDLGFAQVHETQYHVVEQVVPRDLRESLSYQQHLLYASRVSS